MATVPRLFILLTYWLALPGYADDSPFHFSSPATQSDRFWQVTPLALLESKTIPDHLTLQQNKARVGSVFINRGNVFDPTNPEEDFALFRFANRIHIMTQETVIRSQLLFGPGDYYSHRALQESERILRNSDFLADASIQPIAYHEETNTVDIEVVTRDAWTFKGGVSFSREGGSNEITGEIQESNLLGYGKDLKFRASSGVERNESLVRYQDRSLWGSRNRMSLLYNDKSDGITKYFKFERPFFSLTTEWSLGFSTASDDRVTPLYDEGEIFSEFAQSSQNLSLFWGLAQRQYENLVYRWRFGFEKSINEYSTAEDYPDAVLPENRDWRYPWVSLEIFEDQIIRTTHIHQIRRTEDLNLGNEINALIGWSDPVFTAEDDGVIFSFNANTAFQFSDNQLLLFNPYTSGHIADGKAQNSRLGFRSKFYWPSFHQQVFYMAFSAEYARNLYRDQQLLLGGDSGLRGYPLRFQNGDRKFLFTVEQRFYTTWHWFELAYVGALAFFDVGRAWFPGQETTENSGVLKDVGIGLRMASSRGSRGVILHIDLAFALDGASGIDDTQLVITSRETF